MDNVTQQESRPAEKLTNSDQVKRDGDDKWKSC